MPRHNVPLAPSVLLRRALILLVTLVVAETTLLKDFSEGHPFYDLLIVIPCHGSRDVTRRTAVRKSWAQYTSSPNCEPCRRHKVKVLFVAGMEGNQQELKDEAAEFDDVGVLPDFGQFEYYTARAEKTQRSLRYAMEHFRFRLLLKTDTDSWVFVDRLLKFLEERSLFTLDPNLPGIYGGDFADGSGVHAVQDPSAKWFDGVFQAFTGEQVYPRHAKGAGYLLSPDLVQFIAAMGAGSDDNQRGVRQRNSSKIEGDDARLGKDDRDESEGGQWARMPRLEDLPSEDVSIGFWLQAVNHTKVEMPVSIKDSACTADRSKSLVVDHYVTQDEMVTRWCRYLQTGDPCDSTASCLPAMTVSAEVSTEQPRPRIALLSALRTTHVDKEVRKYGIDLRRGEHPAAPPEAPVPRRVMLQSGQRSQRPLIARARSATAEQQAASKADADAGSGYGLARQRVLIQQSRGLSSVASPFQEAVEEEDTDGTCSA